MSSYIKASDDDWDYERRDCDCDRIEKVIADKDGYCEKECGCGPCKPLRPKQRGIVLASAKQNMDIEIDPENLPVFPIKIAQVPVDTTCLCSPLVLINFCSTILGPTLLGTDAIEYTITLFKECDNIPKYPLAVYTFSREAPAGSPSSDSFCFQFCDLSNCSGCCFYTAELTNIGTQSTPSGTVTISRGIISAKAQGACNDNKYIDIDKAKNSNKDCGCIPREELHPKQRGVITACGTQSRDIVVPTPTNPPDINPPIEIARVNIDTSSMCNPLVVIDFSSTIEVPVQTSADLTITLSKVCEGLPKQTLDTFNFSTSAPVITGSTIRSFCFDFCDFNNNCTGCCSYIVELTQSADNEGSIISQGVITANAQGAC